MVSGLIDSGVDVYKLMWGGTSEAAPFNGECSCDLGQMEVNSSGAGELTDVSGGGTAGFGKNQSLSFPRVQHCRCDGITGHVP